MRIGEFQSLRVARKTEHGLYLADACGEEVLLPKKECALDDRIGEKVRVFVLTDSEDRPVATKRKPLATVGDFALLQVVSVTGGGAFLDWGLDKDLFCPIREQQLPMREGSKYVVRVYLDEVSGRPACSSKFARFLGADGRDLTPGQPVKILVTGRGPDLISVIVDSRIRGSIFPDEWHERLEIGEVRDAYVKSIRPEDHKVAISLRPQGFRAIAKEGARILELLDANSGFLPISDKSSPEEIHRMFGLSKGAFKRLIGALYKEGRIEIRDDGIRLR